MGEVFLGDGNDSLTASATAWIIPEVEVDPPTLALSNSNLIDTGDGDDIISSTDAIYNRGVINTGNGNDSIIGIIDIAFITTWYPYYY
jgi:hypothetical protein